MKIISKKTSAVTATILMASFLSACGGSDKLISDIVDHADTPHQASITYVNALERSTTFYTKSTVYPDSVYKNKHRVIELLANDVSNVSIHKWIEGAKETKFAYQDSNSASDKKEMTENLLDNERYWSIAWQQNGEREFSLFEKKPTNQANKLKVRIFSNAELDISINQQAAISTTEVGVVSAVFAIDGCSDLSLGEFAIDLCQSGDYGRSYLVVFDNESGSVVIAQE